jgi:hypothetical protein
MWDRIIDETNPRYSGPLPKPRGLLPVPPEIVEELARTQAAHPLKKFSDDYAKMTRDDWTLRYYYEGEEVACRSIPEGIEVLAVGPEEVRRLYQETPPEDLHGVLIRDP